MADDAPPAEGARSNESPLRSRWLAVLAALVVGGGVVGAAGVVATRTLPGAGGVVAGVTLALVVALVGAGVAVGRRAVPDGTEYW
ncbi:MAG: hypothetical protein ABEJ79_04120 [Halolamina sp.]